MIWLWLRFIFIIIALLALDLGVLHRKAHVIKPKEAFVWTAFWITLALLFNVLAYVGVKMILSHHYPIPTFASLMVIIGILSVGILASVYATKKDTAKLKSPL